MNANEKLDFLMKLTSTPNIALARRLNLDPSHVSRLRSGARNLTSGSSYLMSAADYFAGKCTNEYCRMALYEASSNPNMQTAAGEELAGLIAKWLGGDDRKHHSRDNISEFLQFFNKFTSSRRSTGYAGGIPRAAERPADIEGDTGVGVYYGSSGKREASMVFFQALLDAQRPGIVYLSNDIPFDWVSEEPGFSDKLGEIMFRVVQHGYTFQRIQHPIRDMSQTFDSVSRWLPLYLTGAVREYVYPGLRDNVLHQSLLVVPDRICMLSTATGDQAAGGVTFIFTDKRIVSAYAHEFCAFLSMCRPLTTVHTAAAPDLLYRCLADFYQNPGSCIQKSGMLSINSMPAEVLERIGRRAGADISRYIGFAASVAEYWRQSGWRHGFTDIIRLADPEDIRLGRSINPLSHLVSDTDIAYTPEEYRLHLEHILLLMETYPNYHVYLCDDNLPDTHIMSVRECYKSLAIKITDPFAVFEMSNANIVSASWEYTSWLAKQMTAAQTRAQVMDQLHTLAGRLKAAEYP